MNKIKKIIPHGIFIQNKENTKVLVEKKNDLKNSKVITQKNNDFLLHLFLKLCEIRPDVQNRTTENFKILKHPKNIRPRYAKYAIVGKIRLLC